MVCKTWNLFLINDRKLWMDILRQTQPFFEFVSKQLLKDQDITDEAKSKISIGYWSEECFDFIQEKEDFCCQKSIKAFKRIQMIHIALQDVIQDCPAYEVFQKKFIGEKLFGEIQLQIDGTENKEQDCPKMFFQRCVNLGYPEFESSFSWFLQRITDLKVCRDKIEQRKSINHQLLQLDQNFKNINDQILELREKEFKVRKHQLLLGIKTTLIASCIDV